jgi:hypothetical protein
VLSENGAIFFLVISGGIEILKGHYVILIQAGIGWVVSIKEATAH